MSKISKPILISIVGPTAVGKTGLSILLAEWLNAEIVSADSRQFYKEMTIGTAKPGPLELHSVTHHFINSHSIDELYSAGEFGRDAVDKICELHQHNQTVIAVGGSGLYLKAIWEGFDEMPNIEPDVRRKLNEELDENGLKSLQLELKAADPEYYQTVDLQNGQRVIRALEVIRGTGKPFSSFRVSKKIEMPYDHLKIGLNMDRELLFSRIDQRMDIMIEQGLFAEAERLYPYREHNALQTVGYSEIFGHIDGEYDKDEAVRLLKRNSRRYAKRQLTWFRKYDDIHWFSPDQLEEIKSLIQKSLHRVT
ncbi:tRNA dimethylallyltransferase [Ekhidna lutea]|uniref:tRNA dimethylallyltransferase n=1 Tax=Ekhidna lutea TaxID=447679 RepID=A0A239K038_EKHLU|nr:tRNA (adenosine(37)-N6)-dimethylallyltransferase MiaA [Ekhidna lutea]SNT11421.1 tRNA dimethylallyltransferase [Ekhidna lutea]